MIIMKNRSTTVRSSLAFPAILVGAAMLSGLYFYSSSHTRQYSPVTVKAEKDKDAGAAGMYQYFLNARKNSAGVMDYAAMLSTEKQLRAMQSSHKDLGTMGLNWRTLGPTNIGGRTRAILIDKNDPTHNTIFAGGVSGGLWKSTNGGASWDSINDNLSNICVASIAQDSSGNIFIGTGEGFSLYVEGEAFSTGILGGGMFESTDDGKNFTLLTKTLPSANNSGVAWAYINRIAVLPTNSQVIYAATNGGLEMSQDGGATWAFATNASGTKLNSNTLDVKCSEDGAIVVACINGTAYYAYTASSITKFSPMHNTGYGSIPGAGGGRIEFAMAPSNPNYIYASVIGPADNLVGIYFTMTAITAGNGGNWYDIGPGGSKSFDPYSSGGVQEQGTYDNTLGVFPNNPGKVLVGGTTLYSWTQSSPSDTLGQWKSITTYYGYPGDPTYIHPDEHAIVFDKNNANIVYSGSDGGVYKSTDGGKTFADMDRNYNVTQFYAIAFAPYVTAKTGEGVMGGTQDNGTPYMGGQSSFYPRDGIDLSGGDGGQCAISSINPNAYYVSADFNSLLRSANLGGAGTPSNAYTNTKGLNKGANIDSVVALGSGCFVEPMALYENPYDVTTLDKLLWVSDKAYNAGDTIYPISPNGNITFPYVLKNAVPGKGDSVIIQNRVVSKVATGFSASNYVWINMQAIDFQDPTVWMPIGGPQSKPDAFTGGDQVHCLTWSPDGDALFVGTEQGQLFRFSNLDSIQDTAYTTGAIISIKDNVKAPVVNPLTRVISKSLTAALGAGGRDILSISVDPKNGNNVLVTLGGYGFPTNIYRSTNALSAAPTFASAQGNLPPMPVYGSVVDLVNSTFTGGAVVATEHGIYSTANVLSGAPTWSSDNTGMANTLVCAIKQQILPPWQCNNSGDIYIGTHGRGAYVDTTFFKPLGIQPLAASSLKVEVKVYPNPMNAGGTISFTLPKTDRVTVTIYDIQGKVVKEIPVASDAPGLHNISINTLDMQVGVYLATVTGTDFRQTTRFVVAR
jgi:photosystem II stability/assembly factor-like uncharacterized protein